MASDPARPDDIRAAGWSVAVHNDYRCNGFTHTFWLFVKDGRAIKGEGMTDASSLDDVRRQIGMESPSVENTRDETLFALTVLLAGVERGEVLVHHIAKARAAIAKATGSGE